MAVIACGAIAGHVSEISSRRGWRVDVHPLPPLLHNRPERIAAAVSEAAAALRPRYDVIAVGYADCGTYGALRELGLPMLGGQHCYDVFAGAARLQELLEQEPGTYVLTDYLALSFERSVIAELGLDRHPELHEDYFRHYRRVVWLAQHRSDRVRAAADRAAAYLGLPLEVVDAGDAGLERALAELLAERDP